MGSSFALLKPASSSARQSISDSGTYWPPNSPKREGTATLPPLILSASSWSARPGPAPFVP